ncbi:MAG TPA: hypothetical protein VFW98_08185, partial [Gemmatimonadaceae bacterium]|nr:hypothetical protein [Gemmatimonadaceae bacterium]
MLSLDTLTLDRGAHDTRDDGVCAMEAVAWLAGEPHSDTPECASPVIAAFVRSWNDALSDADRTRLLRPILPLLIGTRTTQDDDEARAWLATDWLARVCAPAWLRIAGLDEHARALEATARIVDAVTARAAQPALHRARKAGAAARDAAWAAAGAAAGAAA